MTSLYELADLRVRIGAAEILRGISVGFQDHEMVTIVGPNGAGKSTLMSVLSGYRTPMRGAAVSADARSRAGRNAISLAIWLSFPKCFVWSSHSPPNRWSSWAHAALPRAVRVALGSRRGQKGYADNRHPRLRKSRVPRTQRRRAAAGRPSRGAGPGTLGSAARRADDLFGLKHQISTYGLLKQLAGEGIAVIAVTHDLNLAATYSDRMVVLSRGEIAADGKPEEVLRTSLLEGVFEVAVEIREGPTGRPWVFYDPGKMPNESPTGR